MQSYFTWVCSIAVLTPRYPQRGRQAAHATRAWSCVALHLGVQHCGFDPALSLTWQINCTRYMGLILCSYACAVGYVSISRAETPRKTRLNLSRERHSRVSVL